MKPTFIRWAALLLAALLSSASWAQTERFTLANGLAVIVQPDRRAPTAVHMLWVRVGSMDEVDGASGVAHVLEHMMFKGTPTVGPGEYSRRVAALGGTHNAFTSRDATVYHQQVPSDQVLAVMALEADRFANNQWSDDEFRREIEVIKEERRQRVEESPRARFFEAYTAQVFLASPYRRPVIGWMSDIESLTPDDARAFHRQWYVPANAAVVVAGDVDPQQVRLWAEQTYGRIPAKAVPERKPRVEPTQQGPRRLEYRARAEQSVITLGWKVPKLRDPAATDAETQDALALTLLASVLDGYNGARLGRALVQGEGGQRLADSVDAGYGLLGRGPQLFSLTGVPAPGVGVDQLADALRTQVRRVAEQGVTEAELQRVKTQWRASEVYKLDSVVNQARELGSYWLNGWGLDAGERLLQRLMAVTPAQVQSVAQRLFDERQLSVGVLVPEAKP
ncbi:M16 family metallopeptidase [Hydrogenophaga defluvii]|uniref:M16 family metallopeptidase n=1 Tax=Hydrogenophaga defluvii TaxID=249410 RepID=A0ABW2SGL8_9BURK